MSEMLIVYDCNNRRVMLVLFVYYQDKENGYHVIGLSAVLLGLFLSYPGVSHSHLTLLLYTGNTACIISWCVFGHISYLIIF